MIVQGAELNVTRQCQLLGVNRSAVYYTPRAVTEEDLRIMRRIDELHLEHPFYGARRLAKQLKREGFEVGRLHGVLPASMLDYPVVRMLPYRRAPEVRRRG
jgi:putative transposase